MKEIDELQAWLESAEKTGYSDAYTQAKVRRALALLPGLREKFEKSETGRAAWRSAAEAGLARAQEHLERAESAESQLAEKDARIAGLEKALWATWGDLQTVQMAAALSGTPAREWAGFGGHARKALAVPPGMNPRDFSRAMNDMTPEQIATAMKSMPTEAREWGLKFEAMVNRAPESGKPE